MCYKSVLGVQCKDGGTNEYYRCENQKNFR